MRKLLCWIKRKNTFDKITVAVDWPTSRYDGCPPASEIAPQRPPNERTTLLSPQNDLKKKRKRRFLYEISDPVGLLHAFWFAIGSFLFSFKQQLWLLSYSYRATHSKTSNFNGIIRENLRHQDITNAPIPKLKEKPFILVCRQGVVMRLELSHPGIISGDNEEMARYPCFYLPRGMACIKVYMTLKRFFNYLLVRIWV